MEGVKCINLHPGYNPENKGWYPQVFSILNGKKFGATLHEMDDEIDGGAIIAQEQIKIEFNDTSYTAYQKVLKLEKKIFKQNISKILTGEYLTNKTSGGNYNSKNDFKKLQNLNLGDVNTLEYHINILRALTFPGFDNAVVEKGGKSYVIKIDIEELKLNRP